MLATLCQRIDFFARALRACGVSFPAKSREHPINSPIEDSATTIVENTVCPPSLKESELYLSRKFHAQGFTIGGFRTSHSRCLLHRPKRSDRHTRETDLPRQGISRIELRGDDRTPLMRPADNIYRGGLITQFGWLLSPSLAHTAWSWIVWMVAGIGLLGHFDIWLLRQLNAKARLRLTEELKERERIAYELHDALLQDIQAVILQLHTATEQMNVNDADRTKLEEVLAHFDSVLGEAANRVLECRPNVLDTSDLATAFAIIGEELNKAHPASFHVMCHEPVRPLHLSVRDELYRVGREVITNSFKHAHADAIEVELVYEPDQLIVRFRDNGKGFDVERLDADGSSDHRGLREIEKRAQNIGGRLEIQSGKDAGTQVILSVPRVVATWFLLLGARPFRGGNCNAIGRNRWITPTR
jgi:signal transduction histidine kinase